MRWTSLTLRLLCGRYELLAMRFIGITLIMFSFFSFASGGPKEVTLTPELAETLGFNIQVNPEGLAIMIEMEGPLESPSGCPAKRSGSFLLGSNGEELFVYITELPVSNSKPEAIGYYTNKSHEMGVFIDYLCKGTKVLKSIRYSVPSISKWLITRPSN
nr:hypothetical protein [uncultured Pseudoteredinibacter sp.]